MFSLFCDVKKRSYKRPFNVLFLLISEILFIISRGVYVMVAVTFIISRRD